MKSKHPHSLRAYSALLAEMLYRCGRERTAETYISATNSLFRFLDCDDISIDSINSSMITSYENYLHHKGLAANTTSFYIRNLRAIYNRAVDDGIVTDSKPFRRVYTGTSKTLKRAIDAKTIHRIANFDTNRDASLQFAVDMFMFSFYTQGMAFVDIATLKWSDIQSGYLTYRRRKTGQQITIRWEACMQRIAERYDNCSQGYIFPIIKGKNPRREYLNAAHTINRKLKEIGSLLQTTITLTLYVARHSWASIAYNEQIPVHIISRALGHNSESTTRIYLASLDNSAMDNANKQVLQAISF